ncbi:MAG: periplasmic heavy metal sensor, partial [Hyphomicrobiaceae bacterium]
MTVTPPSEAPTGTSAVRRAPRWMWIVLVLSVAINLVIAGMAIAAMLHFGKGRGGLMSRFAHYVETLPDDRRAKLRTMLDEHRDRIRPLRRSLRQARRRARDAFRSEPFVREELAQAYAEV